MSAQERPSDRPPLYVIQKFRANPKRELLSFAVDRLDRAIARSPVELAPGADIRYAELREEGGKPLVASSHSVHPDLIALIKPLVMLLAIDRDAEIEQPLDGFTIPIATSVGNGKQGKLLEEGLPSVRARCEEMGIHIIETTRQADHERYGMKTNGSEVTRALKRAVRNNHGLAVFPEASVEAGRLIPPQEQESPVLTIFEHAKYKMGELGLIDAPVHGMQRFDADTMRQMTKILEQEGDTFIVPVGIEGVNRLVLPTYDRKNRPTVKGIAAIATTYDFFAVRVRIGMPEKVSDIRQKFAGAGIPFTDQGYADYVGAQVAGLVPERNQGFYRPYVS